MKKDESNFLLKKSAEIRLYILDMITKVKSSHIGSALSIVDILTVLFHKFINIDLIKQKNEKRDYFILSKGHAVSALYATLASVKLIKPEILNDYYKDGGVLAGHPIRDSLPGVEASTGSLGHGLPLAVGLAIACKKDGIKNKIYVLLGDGECQEGSVWEAILMAVRFKLNNLVLIVDSNKFQGLDKTSNIVFGDWQEKFKAFGCYCVTVDGHDFLQLIKTFNASGETKFPHVIIANTIKGKGISFMQNSLEWHYKSPTQEQYELAKKEIQGI
jgi:transketolase